MKTLIQYKLLIFRAGAIAGIFTVFGLGLVLFGQLDRFSSRYTPPPKKSFVFSRVAQPDKAAIRKTHEIYGRVQPFFVPNQGQTDPQLRFLAPVSRYALYLSPAEAVTAQKQGEDNQLGQFNLSTIRLVQSLKEPDVLRLGLAVGNCKATFEGMAEAAGKGVYVIGSNSANWHTSMTHYGKKKDQTPG